MPAIVSVPWDAALLLTALTFLIGVALGVTIELVNLVARERELARGRRELAYDARLLEERWANFRRLHNDVVNGGSSKLPLDTEEDGR